MMGGARDRLGGGTLSQPLSLPAYEQAVHEQKMRLETSQVRKETSKYLENVERSKQVAAIVERKQKRGEKLLEVSLQSISLSTSHSSPAPPSAHTAEIQAAQSGGDGCVIILSCSSKGGDTEACSGRQLADEGNVCVY